QADLARWNAKLLMTSPMPQYNIVGTGDPRSTLAAMSGMRVRATGGVGKAFAAVGAVPTSVTATEAYNAMESGVVDTVAFAPHAHLAFRTIDIAEWWTENLNPGTVNCPVVVNTDAYAALTDAEREALDSSVDESIAHYVANYEVLLTKWDSILTEKSVTRVSISDDDLAAFRAAAADPIREQWIKDMSAQGLPAQELYDLVMETLKKERM
ncbi:MAG: C4-dicarboxylate ABC transporter substrate-binding protein, partial [Marinosulfonomonas sp.]|nr:C4-dicarboxylate ABC transporter substrate-binding protein [Marinosulfonomonas sp.]